MKGRRALLQRRSSRATASAPIPLDGFPYAPMASARRVFLNGSPGAGVPRLPPPGQRRVRRTLSCLPAARSDPTRHCPRRSSTRTRKVVAVSQGTVDNTDLTKLIVPTLEALEDGPYVVVATTAGTQTAELRNASAPPNVVIEDFIDYDALFPHVDVFVTNGGFGSVLAAMRHGVPVVGGGQDRRARTTSTRGSATTASASISGASVRSRPGSAPPCVGCSADPTYAANVDGAADGARLLRPHGSHRGRAPRRVAHTRSADTGEVPAAESLSPSPRRCAGALSRGSMGLGPPT